LPWSIPFLGAAAAAAAAFSCSAAINCEGSSASSPNKSKGLIVAIFNSNKITTKNPCYSIFFYLVFFGD
jgi:hypothetical protein